MDTSWSLGVLIGIPVLALFIIAGVGLIFLSRHMSKQSHDYGEGRIVLYGAIATIVITVIVGVFSFYPYKYEYHSWQTVTGTVKNMDKRLVADGEGMSEKFVVTYTNGNQRGCLDTRCADVKPGDTLTITCKRAWQFTGTDGYDCNFISNESNH